MRKACRKCGIEKPLSDFIKLKHRKDGVGDCKACHAATGLAWRHANPDKARAHQQTYGTAHPGRKAAAVKKYEAANPEKVKAAKAAWNSKNKVRNAASKRAWIAANRDAHLAIRNNRRARKIAAGGKLSKDLAQRLYILQKGKCPCCLRPLEDDYHLDHIQPLALGGTNTDDNIQLMRGTCNNQKNAKHPIDFMQSRGFLL
jgi:hypothetical protein